MAVLFSSDAVPGGFRSVLALVAAQIKKHDDYSYSKVSQ
jgi:hypothetical protein